MGYTFPWAHDAMQASAGIQFTPVLGQSADSSVRPAPGNILIDGSGREPRDLHLQNQPRRFCCAGSLEARGLEEGSPRGFLAEDQELPSKRVIKPGTWGGARYHPGVSAGALAGLSRRCISVSVWKTG